MTIGLYMNNGGAILTRKQYKKELQEVVDEIAQTKDSFFESYLEKYYSISEVFNFSTEEKILFQKDFESAYKEYIQSCVDEAKHYFSYFEINVDIEEEEKYHIKD